MKQSFQKYGLWYVLGVVMLIALTLSIIAFDRRTDLRIVFLDVGQGDAILIQTPQGKNILVDTGARTIGRNLSEYIPQPRRVVDMMVLTHPDLDHIGGALSVLNEFKVQSLLHSGLLAGIPLYSVIAETVVDQEIVVYEASAGQRIDIEPGVWIDVYSPHDDIESFDANEYSVIMHVHYYDTSVLLTGDATKLNESDLVEVYGKKLQSDILKIGHHGSQTSTLDSFVETVAPEYAIVSAGCNNRFGHPHVGVVTTLYKNRVNILETCTEGDIIFESDGAQWVRK